MTDKLAELFDEDSTKILAPAPRRPLKARAPAQTAAR
jgi:hypothetical protein